MRKIGFIGMGNMGYAMLKGVLKQVSSEEVIITSRSEKKEIIAETGVLYVKGNSEVSGQVKYVILAVKPQQYESVLAEIKDTLTKEQVVISIAPGITIEQIKNMIGKPVRVVRSMPNTPALLGEGMTGVSYEAAEFSNEEIEVIDKIFSSFGKYEKVDEKLMSAVVCASGSSPAYVYMFIEALADSVVKQGLPRQQAYQFVAQAVKGSAQMVLETNLHPGVLKDQVCSPGGTTIAGVAALEEYGMRNAVIKATDACFNKSENMKK